MGSMDWQTKYCFFDMTTPVPMSCRW